MRTATVFAVLLLAAAPTRADEPVSWDRTQREVIEQLRSRDVGDWARSIVKTPVPQDASGLFLRIAVLLRAGHLPGLDPCFDALGKLPAAVQSTEASDLGGLLILRKEWDLARRLFERVPQAHPRYAEHFLDAWPAPATTAEIDAWLVARARANVDGWFGTRVHFLEKRNALGPLVAELASGVRAAPADTRGVMRYVDAQARLSRAADVSWLVEVVKPRLAVDAAAVGQHVAALWPKVAVPFLTRALDMPFTEEDERSVREVPTAAVRSRTTIEQDFRGSVKHMLLNALHAAGETAQAQALLEELTAAYPDGLPPAWLATIAGEIQGRSGARVVEGRIREVEKPKEDSAAYWVSRAQYYVGRQERAEADAAWQRALSLVGAVGREEERAVEGPRRFQVVGALVAWYRQTDRVGEANRLVRREFEAADPASDYAKSLVESLLAWDSGSEDLLKPDDEFLWRFLAARPAWDLRVERVLAEMAPEPASDSFWDRAQALTRGADATRAVMLGWVMTRHGATRRAVPLLEDAIERLDDAEQRETAVFTLLEAHLELNEWKAAEAVWPKARGRLTWREEPEWLGRLAVAAARAGARGDAIRIWGLRANFDRGDVHNLDEMVRAGLRDDLVVFYERMAAADPASVYPSRTLAGLRPSK
jgi:tetratricopeptide (TPR) repeat protein